MASFSVINFAKIVLSATCSCAARSELIV